RYPFCIAEANQEDGQKTSVICVDETALESSGLPLFDKKAEPTDVWQTIEKFINDMEAARQQTNRMTRALDDLDLLEPFEALAMLQGGEKFQLKNMYRVSEQKLNKLPADVIQDLMTEGSLARIYLHIASLNNFSRLVDRAAAGSAYSTIQ
ncbi:MAG: SapC family protein, partial [Immundisolibacteraceae bacterium]|nr:SapC family protein [Immundisolibacteraceae bacterium]